MVTNKKLTVLAACISGLICLVLLLIKVYISISYLPDISGSETSAILPIQRLSDGLPIYTDPEEPTFLMTQYTPIYFVIGSFFVNLLGFEGHEVHKIFLLSRLISITFTLLACVVVWYVLYKRTNKNVLLSSLATFFIYQVLAFWFLTSSRPDSLLVLSFSLFVCSALKALDQKNDKSLWWIAAIFFAVTSFFIKQSGAIHAISLGSFLIYTKQWKIFLKVLGFGILFFTVYLFVLPTASMDVFFTNIIGGVANSVSWGWFYDWTLEKLLLQFAPLLAINFAIAGISLTRRDNLYYQFLAICSILLFILSSSAAFKVGAGVGYFQTYLVASVILITMFIHEKKDEFQLKNILNISVVNIYLVLVAVHCILFVYDRYTKSNLKFFTAQYIEQRDIARFLSEEKNLKDSEYVYICQPDNFNGYYLNHFLYKNSLVPFPDIVYLADKNKTFDFKELNKLVATNRIKYVVSEKHKEPVTILGQPFTKLNKIYSTERLDVYQGY